MNLPPEPFVRVVWGEPDDDALAALTAVLLAKLAAARGRAGHRAAHGGGPRAGWRRPDHGTGYRSPTSWR